MDQKEIASVSFSGTRCANCSDSTWHMGHRYRDHGLKNDGEEFCSSTNESGTNMGNQYSIPCTCKQFLPLKD